MVRGVGYVHVVYWLLVSIAGTRGTWCIWFGYIVWYMESSSDL